MKTRIWPKYRWFRKPLMVLQVQETRHRMEPIGGSGHFDHWDETIWRNATP